MADSSESANKMTVSLTEMQAASDGISAISKAFKELNEEGYITTDALAEIQEKTGLAGDAWAEYEAKLLGAKAGTEEFNPQTINKINLNISHI